ncbi:hypothetical protein HMSSN036_45800 [Paenibacillus macerans]|nr:hypothetical protein HMSSN036_45800 [Paenibacillus macerans]
MESIGYNPNQEKITRPNGYPYYHWLQTEEGEGLVTYGSESVVLSSGCGVLLPPGMPHAYEAKRGAGWATYYLTFGGVAAAAILSAFGIRDSALFRWDPEAPLAPMLGEMLNKVGSGTDLFGLETSAGTYRFWACSANSGKPATCPSPAIWRSWRRCCIGWSRSTATPTLAWISLPKRSACPAAI